MPSSATSAAKNGIPAPVHYGKKETFLTVLKESAQPVRPDASMVAVETTGTGSTVLTTVKCASIGCTILSFSVSNAESEFAYDVGEIDSSLLCRVEHPKIGIILNYMLLHVAF